MHFNRKCWFDLFKEQFISLLNFGQNYFGATQTKHCLELPFALYTAFWSNVGAWVCELAQSFFHHYLLFFKSASFPKYNSVNDSQFVNLIIFFYTQLNSITIKQWKFQSSAWIRNLSVRVIYIYFLIFFIFRNIYDEPIIEQMQRHVLSVKKKIIRFMRYLGEKGTCAMRLILR